MALMIVTLQCRYLIQTRSDKVQYLQSLRVHEPEFMFEISGDKEGVWYQGWQSWPSPPWHPTTGTARLLGWRCHSALNSAALSTFQILFEMQHLTTYTLHLHLRQLMYTFCTYHKLSFNFLMINTIYLKQLEIIWYDCFLYLYSITIS